MARTKEVSTSKPEERVSVIFRMTKEQKKALRQIAIAKETTIQNLFNTYAEKLIAKYQTP
ncbi:MAG: hypothetical protein J6W84_07050 [Bacteroidales bacterium]|nr:hypothetical protein [Bacteroidales bacterium]